MKLTLILLIAACLQVNAGGGYAQKITLSQKDVSLAQVFNEIRDQSGYLFLYNDKQLDNGKKVNIRVKDASIKEVLEQSFRDQLLTYIIIDKTIVVMPKERVEALAIIPEILPPPPVEIHGRVVNQQGDPLQNVSILIAGTTTGTTTGSDGRFTLTAPDDKNVVLEVSSVGYQMKRVSVVGQKEINVVLETDIAGLSDVVVVGYGTQKKVNLTGSIASIKGEELSKRLSGQTSSALQGMASGVTVKLNSGQPGKDGGQIRIRGIGTLSSSNPLILVDGVEMGIDNIDPGMIESISILKDAASSAIYGSRAANGVILITTKRAKKEQMSVTYNGYYGRQTPTNLPQKVNALDHMEYMDEAYINVGRSPIFEGLIEEYKKDSGKDTDKYPDTDWMDLLLKTGNQQNHFLTVSEGTEKVSLLASFGYFKQDGIINNSDFDRYSFRLNTDMKISNKITGHFDVMLRQSSTIEPNSINDNFFQMYRIPSNKPAIFSNGLYGEGWSDQNPLAIVNAGGLNKVKGLNALMNFSLVYKPIEWLTFDFLFAPTYNSSHTKENVLATTLYNPDGSIFTVKPAKSTLTETEDKIFNKNLKFNLLFDKQIEHHHVKVLLGFTQEDFNDNWFSGYREVFLLPQYDVLNAGSEGNKNSNGSGSEWALQSFFGRINYNYKGKYLFETTGRYDGSSRFSKGNRYSFFPSLSVGWRLSEERFMEPLRKTLDNLKIRASWGTLGNQDIGGSFYPFTSSINLLQSYPFNDNLYSGASQLDLANSELKWEQTKMYDIGIDVTLWKKLSIVADYYSKTTTDILLRLDIPGIIGLTAPFQNAGTVTNKGWELGINYFNRIGDLGYSLAANLSDVKNKIVDIKGMSSTSLTQNRQGYPMNSLYGLVATGLFQSEDEIGTSPKQYGTLAPGDVKYKDLDGNGVINDNDFGIFGNTIPRYTYGMNLNLNYKGFDFGIFFQGVGKVDGYLYQSAVMPFYNGGTINKDQVENHWTPEHTNASYPRFAFSSANNEKTSSFWMRSAAYLRLKNLQIGYTIPVSSIRKIGINSLRLYLTGENLFTLDGFYNGFDVEAPVGTGSFYPQVKTYSAGILVKF